MKSVKPPLNLTVLLDLTTLTSIGTPEEKKIKVLTHFPLQSNASEPTWLVVSIKENKQMEFN